MKIEERPMKKIIYSLLMVFVFLCVSSTPWAADKYAMTFDQINTDKAMLDDPSSYYEKVGRFEKVLPKELYDKLVFDTDEMSRLWAEAVGFKAPDVVGKLAPQIKPGKYTLADKERLPFKELMPAHYYNRFNEPGTGGLNHAGNFTEIEVVPTRQYYYATPIAKATIENAGKAKLDENGYLLYKSYLSGLPFPQPSGSHKAWQIVYNYKKNYHDFETTICFDQAQGIDSGFKRDFYTYGQYINVKSSSRLVMEPLGWFDKAAKRMDEDKLIYYRPLAPRDEYGNAYFTTGFNDPSKDPRFFVYLSFTRRIRKMSSSDRQDQSVGSDQTFDDTDGFLQPLRPDEFPYSMKVIEEREFLVPAATSSGSQWMDSKNKFVMKGLQFERRPMWVVEMTQLDKNYIYSKRIGYFDKETLDLWFMENYDQKERLYRTYSTQWAFIPEMGVLTKFNDIMLDFIDLHSTFETIRYFPTPWITRNDISVKSMMKTK